MDAHDRQERDNKHLLDETETTLKFGQFMMTLMYFRAMGFVHREKETWSGESDEISNVKKKKTKSDERMRMDDMAERYVHRKVLLHGHAPCNTH